MAVGTTGAGDTVSVGVGDGGNGVSLAVGVGADVCVGVAVTVGSLPGCTCCAGVDEVWVALGIGLGEGM